MSIFHGSDHILIFQFLKKNNFYVCYKMQLKHICISQIKIIF